MAKKDTKQLLFENMEKLNPDFEQPKEIKEIAPVPATSTGTQTQTQQYGRQPDVEYADSTYKTIAPALKMINTPEKFAGAFKGWFQYLGYSPQQGNMTIQRARMDVENILKTLGYK